MLKENLLMLKSDYPTLKVSFKLSLEKLLAFKVN